MITRRRALEAGVAGLFVPLAPLSSASAQGVWPTHEIVTICGFPPGNGADVIVRFYAKMFQDRIGKTVLVENRPGAFGNISTEALARAKPDGYTVGIIPSGVFLAAAPSLFKNLAFDPVGDFHQVTTLMKLTFVLVVPGDSPFKTVADLTRHLQQVGDKASYGSASNLGLVASELYKASAGLPTVEVKYKDPLGMLNDLWAGHIVFTHLDPITIGSHLKSGKLHALATASKDPFKSLPGIPGAAEAGIENSDLSGWWSVVTPKGTPLAIRDRLEVIFNEIVSTEEHRKFFTEIGCDPLPGNHALAEELLARDLKAWREYVKLAKIEPLG